MDIQEASEKDIKNIIELWELCGLTRPWNDPEKDINFAMQSDNATVLVGKYDDFLVASAMAGHDGHRGAAYYVSVHPQYQGRGYGRQLIEAIEGWLQGKGVWKINLLIREDNARVIDFYKELGYEDGKTVQLGKRLDS